MSHTVLVYTVGATRKDLEKPLLVIVFLAQQTKSMTHNSLGLEWKVGQLLRAWQHLTVHSDLTQSSGNEMGLIHQHKPSCMPQV